MSPPCFWKSLLPLSSPGDFLSHSPPPDVQILLHLQLSDLILHPSILGYEFTDSCPKRIKAFNTNPFNSVSLWILTCLSRMVHVTEEVLPSLLVKTNPSIYTCDLAILLLLGPYFLNYSSLLNLHYPQVLYTMPVYVGHINGQPIFLLPFCPFKLPPNPMFGLQTSWKTHLHLLPTLWCRFSSLKFLPSDLSLPPKYFSTTAISPGWRCRKHHAWEEPTLPFFPSPP